MGTAAHTERRALRTLERCRRRVDDEPLKQQGAHLGNGLEPSVRCPLCGGPAREADGRFACEVGHEVDGDTMRDATDARLAEALWMAIEALDSEAEVQRLLGQEPFAAQAAEQAQLLRDFARLHGDHIDT